MVDKYKCLNNNCENNPEATGCLEGKPLGYYFDSDEQIYKKCYEKCFLCFGKGNETIYKNTRNKRILNYPYNKYLLFFLLIKILI